MSAPNEADEKLIQDVVAAVRRAIERARAEGRAEALEQIKRFVSSDAAISSGQPVRDRESIEPRVAHTATGGGQKKYPYGFVTSNVARALLGNPQGLSREGIRDFCKSRLDADIDEASIRNAIKAFVKQKKAARNLDGLYVPGPELRAA
jgi:hypothetical protein